MGYSHKHIWVWWQGVHILLTLVQVYNLLIYFSLGCNMTIYAKHIATMTLCLSLIMGER